MVALTMRSLSFFACLSFGLTLGLTLDTILGDRVQFPKTEQCKKNRSKLQLTWNGGSTQLVAQLEDEWKPAAGYRDRMSPNGSVILDRTNINDHGLYELSCGSEEEEPIQLNVLVPSEISETEGQAAGFTFHCNTVGKLGRYRVERDKQRVFELDLSSGNITQGSGFENRISVAPNWKSDGNLTLTLQGVKPEDQGDYFLYVLKNNGREHLQAVRLRVSPALNTAEDNKKITCTPQPPGKTVWIWVAAVVLIAGAFLCGLKMPRICRSGVSGGAGGGGPTAAAEMQPFTDPRVPEVNGPA
ncbi:uncharacterized protein LOC134875998 [Eleginops maclovinus]|uniref:uncharacterized protein LOC134875998 n=1 Tax=Eleginops maclovinus TaxID=56733 RepID=UPI0030807476